MNDITPVAWRWKVSPKQLNWQYSDAPPAEFLVYNLEPLYTPHPHLLNIERADNPEIGDYWREMCVPIARVLDVNENRVLVQWLGGKYSGKEVSDTDPKPTIMSRQRFAKRLRYQYYSNKTWAQVTPRLLPPSQSPQTDTTPDNANG